MREKRKILVREVKDGKYVRDFVIIGQAVAEYKEGERLSYITKQGEKCQLEEIITAIIKNQKHPKYPERIRIETNKGRSYIIDTF